MARRIRDGQVEPVFRNGTVTVVGIVLSFSLGFMTQWAANPRPWETIDLPAIVLLAAGVVLQLYALALLLDVRSVERGVYDRAKNVFLCGVIATSAGVILALVVDFLRAGSLPTA
jgi:hypothetical protein